jgi:alpha-N-arabinofuranosidase
MKRRDLGLSVFSIVASFHEIASAQSFEQSKGMVRVHIAPNVTRHVIAPALFGSNLQWENSGDGALQINDTRRVEPGVLEGIRAAGISMLRFPGGDLSNTYRWQNGIGPRAQRKPGKTYSGGEQDSLFGNDEFLALAVAAKLEGLITVNPSQDAHEAANWVEYLNGPQNSTWGRLRARNGYATPLNVGYWEIGNEVYSSKQPGYRSATEYASTVKRFASAMKVRDPRIKVGATLEISFMQAPWMPKVLPQLVNWNETVLREAGQDLDFVVVHFYAPNDTSWNDSKLRAHVLAAPEVFQQSLQRLLVQIQKYARTRTEVVMSEFGTAFAEKVVLSKRIASTEGALFNASMLFAAMREPKVTVAAQWSLLNNSQYGMLVHDGQNWSSRPIYEVYRMLKTWHGAQVLGITLDTPNYAIPGLGSVPAMTKVPLVDGIAVRKTDGSIGLALLNRSDSQSLPVEIAIVDQAVGKWAWDRTSLYAKPNASEWKTLHTPSANWTGSDASLYIPPHSITWLNWTNSSKSWQP